MNRKPFFAIVAVIAVFIGWAVIASNHLPAELRKQSQSARNELGDARKKIASERSAVAADAAREPELFRVNGFDREWPGRFDEADARLSDAERVAVTLDGLLRQNKRSSQDEVRQLLGRERERKNAALSEASLVVSDAQKRVDLKRNFGSILTKAQSGAQQLASADLSSVVPKIEKAETDWPSKKDLLQTKLAALEAPKKDAPKWIETAKTLQAKPEAQLTSADYAQALQLEEDVDHAPGTEGARTLAAMSQQLYTSWDNILVDLDKEHDEYREKLKRVVTTVPAPGSSGTTSSQEMWQTVPETRWKALENDIGMTVAHKPLGEFDSEANNTPQPAGYAYIAPPSEGRNQYGYWDNRGGSSVWTWLPEYLILRDLLSNRSYQPIPSYDWDRYRQAQRYGQTYYGRDASGTPKYGSHGTFTQRSYSSSRYVQSGGFSGSKYASGGTSGGGFSGSRYGAGSAPAPSSSASGKRFGSSGADASGHRFGNSSGGVRFGGGGSRSSGRSFGGRRR